MDQRDRLHLAWLAPSGSNQWAVRYQVSPIDQVSSGVPSTLLTFSLDSTESIVSFFMGLDQTSVYLLWSTAQVDQPDRERTYVWAFPLDEPQNGALSEIVLPPENPAPLRWVRPVVAQQARLILTLAVRTEAGWRPAVAFFQAGKRVDFQIVARQPANAGPPAAAVDEKGSVHMAWASRQGAVSHLLLTGGEGDQQNEDRSLALLAGLVRLPLVFLWLFIPVGLIWISPRFAPLSLILYSAAQIIWPRDLFATLPPLLTGLDHFQPAFVAGGTVLIIGAAAATVWVSLSWQKQRAWLFFFLVDALLTWLIFGPNVG